ncbi:hypothetical protein ABK040_007170 [Willaertia magna]
MENPTTHNSDNTVDNSKTVKQEKVDGNNNEKKYYLKLTEVPNNVTEKDVLKFLNGYEIAKKRQQTTTNEDYYENYYLPSSYEIYIFNDEDIRLIHKTNTIFIKPYDDHEAKSILKNLNGKSFDTDHGKSKVDIIKVNEEVFTSFIEKIKSLKYEQELERIMDEKKTLTIKNIPCHDRNEIANFFNDYKIVTKKINNKEIPAIVFMYNSKGKFSNAIKMELSTVNGMKRLKSDFKNKSFTGNNTPMIIQLPQINKKNNNNDKESEENEEGKKRKKEQEDAKEKKKKIKKEINNIEKPSKEVVTNPVASSSVHTLTEIVPTTVEQTATSSSNNNSSISGFKIKEIVCGDKYTCLLTEQGDLLISGMNSIGHLGVEGTVAKHFMKVKEVNNIEHISISSFHSLLSIKETNELYSCGYNNYGQLGHNDKIDRNRFENIKMWKREPVMKLKCSDTFSVLLTQFGDLYACGFNYHGELGLGDRQERLVFTKINTIPYSVIQFNIGKDFLIAVTSLGDLYGCGNNTAGNLGAIKKELAQEDNCYLEMQKIDKLV